MVVVAKTDHTWNRLFSSWATLQIYSLDSPAGILKEYAPLQFSIGPLDSQCAFVMADMIQAFFLNLHGSYLCIGPPNQ